MANNYSKLPVIVIEDNQPAAIIESLRASNLIGNILLNVENNQVKSFLNNFEVTAIVLHLNPSISEGINLLKQITYRYPLVPVVIITEVNQIDTAVECIKLGAFDYLTQPINADRLANSIKQALNFRCLKKAASLLCDTPCISNNRIVSDEKNGSPPLPFILQGDVPERLRKAVNYIEVNLSKPLSLKCLAQQACLSKYHFSREFKKYTGMSPIHFMMNRRVCLATLLLQNKDLPISNVATRSGFYDQSEFARWFKKATGFTSSWCRKSFATRDE